MTTRRKVLALILGGFLALTAAYVFIYLARAFTVSEESAEFPLVTLSHTDNFARTILVAVFFLIGEIFAVYLALSPSRTGKEISLRGDLWEWLKGREELTGESAEAVAERAISSYRARLEGGDSGLPSI
jgi:hypothetical protein